jgi:PAS domain S-box-containing protein
MTTMGALPSRDDAAPDPEASTGAGTSGDVAQGRARLSAVAESAGSESPLMVSIEEAPDPLLWIERDGRISYANPAAWRMLGRTREELLGTTLFALAPSFSQETWPNVWNVLETEGPVTFDLHWVTRDGTRLLVEVSAAHVRSPQGDHVSAWARDCTRRREREARLLEAQDQMAAQVHEAAAELARLNEELRREIEERKEVERTLRSWEERHRLIADSVTDVVWTCDLEGYLTYVSPSVERVLGYSPFDLVSTAIAELVEPMEFARITARLLQQRDAAESTSVQPVVHAEVQHKLGHRVACESTVRHLGGDEGQPIGLIGITRDVTERKRMEEALIRSERMAAVGTLAAGIAHEFNNLNHVILASVELALNDDPVNSVLATRLETIRRAALKGSTIVNNLLSFGARQTSDLGMGSLNRAVESALSLVEDELTREGILLVRRLGTTPQSLMSEGQIAQVVLNLLTNARHALLERPVKRIEVETGTEGTTAYLRVSDTGCGIPKAHLTRIFTPFFSTKGEHSAGDGPQSRVKGTGLGLGVSQTIVSNHGGLLGVESDEGVGTTFTMRLPVRGEATRQER